LLMMAVAAVLVLSGCGGGSSSTPAASPAARVVPGQFRCPDPEATAWRLTALLDGLGLQVTVHEGLLSRDQLLRYVRRAAATELDVPEASFERAAKRVARDVA